MSRASPSCAACFPLFERLPPARRTTNSIQPDFLRTGSRRTLDVKTGYPDGDIELEQIRNYNTLVNFSQSRGGGDPGAPSKGWASRAGATTATTTPSSATARTTRAWPERVHARATRELGAWDAARFGFYYLADDGQIYRYLGPDNSVKIGPQMPD